MFKVEQVHLHTCLGCCVVVVFPFHNDVPPEPQQNVSMAAIWGAITCLGHSNVVFIHVGIPAYPII